MWAIFLLCDINSPKIRFRKDEREEDIKLYYLEDEKFDFSKYEDLIQQYPKVVLTKIQRELKTWQDKIEERNKFIEKQTYNERTFEMLDKIAETLDTNTSIHSRIVALGEYWRLNRDLYKSRSRF